MGRRCARPPAHPPIATSNLTAQRDLSRLVGFVPGDANSESWVRVASGAAGAGIAPEAHWIYWALGEN